MASSDICTDAAATRESFPHSREAVGVEGLHAAQVDGCIQVFLADGLVVDTVAPIAHLLFLRLLQEECGGFIVGAVGADSPAARVLLVWGGVVERRAVGQGYVAVAVKRWDVGIRCKIRLIPVLLRFILLAAVILGKEQAAGVRKTPC